MLKSLAEYTDKVKEKMKQTMQTVQPRLKSMKKETEIKISEITRNLRFPEEKKRLIQVHPQLYLLHYS